MVVSRKNKSRKERGKLVQPVNGILLQRALSWAIQDKIFHAIKPHGNTVWTVYQLVILAVLWVWSDHRNLTGCHRSTNKAARYRPPTKDKPSAQMPTIVLATHQQRHAYQRLLAQAA